MWRHDGGIREKGDPVDDIWGKTWGDIDYVEKEVWGKTRDLVRGWGDPCVRTPDFETARQTRGIRLARVSLSTLTSNSRL